MSERKKLLEHLRDEVPYKDELEIRKEATVDMPQKVVLSQKKLFTMNIPMFGVGMAGEVMATLGMLFDEEGIG